MITKMPKWVLTNTNPSFYDSESLTAVEQSARLTGKVEEVIDSCNLFMQQIETAINNYTNSTEQDIECFKNDINKIMNDYINSIDLTIKNAKEYMKDNIVETTSTLFNEALENGDITANLSANYNSETEEVEITINGGA